MIPARDGYPLAASVFAPEGVPRGVLVINSATAISRHIYQRMAHFFSRQGLEVITYDYRGIAGSRPERLRGFAVDFRQWATMDYPAVLDHADRRGDLPIYVLGHSLGGTILGMSVDSLRVHRFITVGAQTAYFRDWPGWEGVKLYLNWHGLLPALTAVWGYFPGRWFGQLEDVPASIVRRWHARRLEPDIRKQLRQSGMELYYDQLTQPMLVVRITDDPIGSRPAIDRLHRMFSRAQTEHFIVHPDDYGQVAIGHFGIIRAAMKQELWPKWADWLLKS